MKKLCLGLAILAAAATVDASTVWWGLTNWDLTLSTNASRINPVGPVTANGNAFVIGPTRTFNPVGGLFTNNFAPANYQLNIIGTRFTNIVFSVPNDANTYELTDLLVSSANLFQYTPGVRGITSSNGTITITPGNGKGYVDLAVFGYGTNFTTPDDVTNIINAVGGGGIPLLAGSNAVVVRVGSTNQVSALTDTNVVIGLINANVPTNSGITQAQGDVRYYPLAANPSNYYNGPLVSTFMSRTGSVALISADVSTALGYTPDNPANLGTARYSNSTAFYLASNPNNYASVAAAQNIADQRIGVLAVGNNSGNATNLNLWGNSVNFLSNSVADWRLLRSGPSIYLWERNTDATFTFDQSGKITANAFDAGVGNVNGTFYGDGSHLTGVIASSTNATAFSGISDGTATNKNFHVGDSSILDATGSGKILATSATGAVNATNFWGMLSLTNLPYTPQPASANLTNWSGTPIFTTNQLMTQVGTTNAINAALINAADVKRDFGATGNGSTDDTAAFQSALLSGRHVFVPNGTNNYKITSSLIATNNSQLVGMGSKILFTGTGYCIDQGTNSNITLIGLDINGGQANTIPTGTAQHGILANTYGTNNVITRCFFHNLNGYGVEVKGLSDTTISHQLPTLVLADNWAAFCTVGYQFDGTAGSPVYTSEYLSAHDNQAIYCGFGVVSLAGNTALEGFKITDCTVGMRIGSGSGGNPGHSHIANSTINHCTDAIWIENQLYGFNVGNSELLVGNIRLTNCQNVVIQNCRFAAGTIYIDKSAYGGFSAMGGTNFIRDCFYYSTLAIVRANSDNSVVYNVVDGAGNFLENKGIESISITNDIRGDLKVAGGLYTALASQPILTTDAGGKIIAGTNPTNTAAYQAQIATNDLNTALVARITAATNTSLIRGIIQTGATTNNNVVTLLNPGAGDVISTANNYLTGSNVFAGPVLFLSSFVISNGQALTIETNLLVLGSQTNGSGGIISTGSVTTLFGAQFNGAAAGLTNAQGQSINSAIMGVIQTGATTNNNVVTLAAGGSSNITDSGWTAVINNLEVKTNATFDGSISVAGSGNSYFTNPIVIRSNTAPTVASLGSGGLTFFNSNGAALYVIRSNMVTSTTTTNQIDPPTASGGGTGISTNGGTGINNAFTNAVLSGLTIQTNGTLISSNWLTSAGPGLAVTNFSQTIAAFTANTNWPAQVWVKNYNTSTNASSRFTAESGSGDGGMYYAAFGMNNTNFSSATNALGSTNDAYLFVKGSYNSSAGGSLYIGVVSTNNALTNTINFTIGNPSNTVAYVTTNTLVVKGAGGSVLYGDNNNTNYLQVTTTSVVESNAVGYVVFNGDGIWSTNRLTGNTVGATNGLMSAKQEEFTTNTITTGNGTATMDMLKKFSLLQTNAAITISLANVPTSTDRSALLVLSNSASSGTITITCSGFSVLTNGIPTQTFYVTNNSGKRQVTHLSVNCYAGFLTNGVVTHFYDP